MALLIVVLLWFMASIPVAMVVGRRIGSEATLDAFPPPPEQSGELLGRLRHIELEEIPRVRLAIEGWVDDPHLSTELRALRAEAERLRQVLREADLHPVERSRVPVPEAVRFRVADHRRKRSPLRGGSSVNP